MKLIVWDIKGDKDEYTEIVATCKTCNCFADRFHFAPLSRRIDDNFVGRCCAHPPIPGNNAEGKGFPEIYKGQCCADWQKIIG